MLGGFLLVNIKRGDVRAEIAQLTSRTILLFSMP